MLIESDIIKIYTGKYLGSAYVVLLVFSFIDINKNVVF